MSLNLDLNRGLSTLMTFLSLIKVNRTGRSTIVKNFTLICRNT